MNPFDLKQALLAKHVRHLVPIHFPSALLIAGVGLDFVAHWGKRLNLTAAAYYNFLVAAQSTLPVIATGLLAWEYQLEGRRLKGILLEHLVLGSISSLLIWLVWYLHFRARHFPQRTPPSLSLIGRTPCCRFCSAHGTSWWLSERIKPARINQPRLLNQRVRNTLELGRPSTSYPKRFELKAKMGNVHMKHFHNSICRCSTPINLLVLSACLFLVPLSLRAQTALPNSKQTRHSLMDGSKDPLQQVSMSLQTLSNQVSPSVVQIFNAAYTSDGEHQNGNEATSLRRSTSGSGVILASDGWIVTNAHVVQGSRRIRVRLNSGLDSSGEQNAKSRRPLLDAKVIVSDRETDLALLKIEADRLPVLELADSSDLKQGQLVLAFGSPLGLDNSVSLGIVSSVARQLDPDSPTIYVQTDAAINPGNSGGPLVDTNGRVVGINTFILTQSGGNEGIGLAIPSNVVRSVYNDVRSEGHVHHHQIGVSVRTVTPALASALGLNRQDGVLIEDVNFDGTASSAGLMPGDIILSVNGRPVHDTREYALGLYSFAVGEKAKLEVQRNSQIHSYQVPVTERQDLQGRLADVVAREQINIPQLGILVLTLDDKLRDMLPPLRHRLGVVVTGRLSEGSYLGEQPLPGDVIYSVNGAPVDGVDSLRSVLETLQDVDAIALQVERLGTLHYLLLNADQ